MPVNPQNISFSDWETPALQVTMNANGSIAGQTRQLNIRDLNDNVLLVLNSTNNPGQFTLTDGTNSTPAVYTFIPTSANIGAVGKGDFRYDIWRIDAGFERREVWGTLSILREQWKVS